MSSMYRSTKMWIPTQALEHVRRKTINATDVVEAWTCIHFHIFDISVEEQCSQRHTYNHVVDIVEIEIVETERNDDVCLFSPSSLRCACTSIRWDACLKLNLHSPPQLLLHLIFYLDVDIVETERNDDVVDNQRDRRCWSLNLYPNPYLWHKRRRTM